MASLESINSVWNDDLPWGPGEKPKTLEDDLVVLTLLPEQEPQTESPSAKESWGSPDWS